MAPPIRPVVERMEGRYLPVPEAGCWLWEGAVDRLMRPLIWHDGTNTRASRHVLEHKLGRPIREGMQANHTCDVSLCVNPAHLYEGTQRDNVADMHRRGRYRNQFTPMTHCIHGHPLSGANLYVNPSRPTYRGCNTCRRAAVDRYNQRRKK
jgi:hypothetical protein